MGNSMCYVFKHDKTGQRSKLSKDTEHKTLKKLETNACYV